jgi:hypothetical protein
VRGMARGWCEAREGARNGAVLIACSARGLGRTGCGMTDYYLLNGLTFGNNAVASSSTCTAPANPSNGAYADTCATGSTLYSGNSGSATMASSHPLPSPT